MRTPLFIVLVGRTLLKSGPNGLSPQIREQTVCFTPATTRECVRLLFTQDLGQIRVRGREGCARRVSIVGMGGM